jgi:hypothetical protein
MCHGRRLLGLIAARLGAALLAEKADADICDTRKAFVARSIHRAASDAAAGSTIGATSFRCHRPP